MMVRVLRLRVLVDGIERLDGLFREQLAEAGIEVGHIHAVE